MVAPLIIGGARALKVVSRGVSKTTRRKHTARNKTNVVKQRELRQGMRQARRMSDTHSREDQKEGNLKTLIGRPFDSRQQRSKRIRNKLLKVDTPSKSKITKTKAIGRGIMTLGSLAYPMMTQSLFAILFMASLALENNVWTGWAIPGITLASVLWAIIIAIGSFTMLSAGFSLMRYFRKVEVVIAFMICFILNWVPFFFIIPWTGIWIAYVIKKQ